jgi:NAD(P)-dependent dehydrogenase (short-subunit alcohol dehydrogenase family)
MEGQLDVLAGDLKGVLILEGDLVRTLDVELRPHGIRVNAVAPQLLDTAPNRAAFPAEMMAHAVAPQAIADIIAFLVSDAAAPVSGAILPAYGS